MPAPHRTIWTPISGHYYLGDISFKGFVSVYNLHSMYWKQSKTMVDQKTPHVQVSSYGLSRVWLEL